MSRRSSQPTQSSSSELAPRKAAILEAVVAEHIDTAQPVGSSVVAANTSIAASPATIRSEMVSLEREGFLTQPHTSAGRIPTDQGYRYFVDHLERGEWGPAQQSNVASFFQSLRGEIESVLEQTSTYLARLTNYTSVVVGSGHTNATIRTALLVDMGANRVMVVAIFSDGSVDRRNFECELTVTAAQIVEASSQLNALLLNSSLDQHVEVPAGNRPIALLVREAVAALHGAAPTTDGEQVFIGGSSRVSEAFPAKDTVSKVLGFLEQELIVVSLIEDMMSRGLSVAIGAETGVEPLAACAVVVAPVTVDGVHAGAVGLIGPSRMNYSETMSAAHAVSTHLAHRLGNEKNRG